MHPYRIAMMPFLKNRVDVPDSYLDVSFATVRALKAPIPTHRRDRANWREVDASSVKELEGAALGAEARTAEAPTVSVNCR